MAALRLRWERLSLLTRFTLTGLAVTALIGVALGWALARQLEQSALEQEAASAADQAALTLDPFFRPGDFAGPLPPDRRQALQALIAERIERSHIVRVKIWNRAGQVIYSDDESVVGQSYPVVGELAEALEGEVATEISTLGKEENQSERGRYSRLMEIYVPIRLAGGAGIVGAYELYHDLDVVAPRIAAMQQFLWLSLALGLGVLYAALYGLVRQASEAMRRQSQELARLQAQRELDRMKSEFLSIVSHELRSPLASLVGFSELLLARCESPEVRRKWIETMHTESLRLSGLIDELLDVSRIEEGRIHLHLEALDVTRVVARAVAAFPTQTSTHQLEARHEGELPPVLADAERLLQVLINLISNAIKYSPGGGSVTVTTRAAGSAVRIAVADEGLGLPPEALPHLFERFRRIDDPARQSIRGTGLGLYITRQLVELQGGRVWAESPGAGQGSTFYVELPVAPAGGSPATVTSPPVERSAG